MINDNYSFGMLCNTGFIPTLGFDTKKLILVKQIKKYI